MFNFIEKRGKKIVKKAEEKLEETRAKAKEGIKEKIKEKKENWKEALARDGYEVKLKEDREKKIKEEENIELRYRVNAIQNKPEAYFALTLLVGPILADQGGVERIDEGEDKKFSDAIYKVFCTSSKNDIVEFKLKTKYSNESDLHEDASKIIKKVLVESKLDPHWIPNDEIKCFWKDWVASVTSLSFGKIGSETGEQLANATTQLMAVGFSPVTYLLGNGQRSLWNLFVNWDTLLLGDTDTPWPANNIRTYLKVLACEPNIKKSWRKELERALKNIKRRHADLNINERTIDRLLLSEWEKKKIFITNKFDKDKEKIESKLEEINLLSKSREDTKKNKTNIESKLEDIIRLLPQNERSEINHKKLYKLLKVKKNELAEFKYYGFQHAELYGIYYYMLTEEFPNYISKVKDEMGTGFIKFNESFKKNEKKNFGDFVLEKLTEKMSSIDKPGIESNRFYFQPEQVWKTIEDTKDEVRRKTLEMAPTMPPGLQRDDNTFLANYLGKLKKECKNYLDNGGEKEKINEKVEWLKKNDFLNHHKDEIEESFEDIIDSLWYNESSKEERYKWLTKVLNKNVEEELKIYNYQKLICKNKEFLPEKANWPKSNFLPIKLFNVKKYLEKPIKLNEKDIEKELVQHYVKKNEDIKEKISYATLSYVCSDEPPKPKKYMSAKAKRSLSKVIGACKYLKIDYLWVDKICVNQKDNN
jgi:hypothetical protein